MDDVRAVMDASVRSEAALLGVSEGGPMCVLFAATYPERTRALIMFGSYARRIWAPDYPWGAAPRATTRRFSRKSRRDWGGPVGLAARAPSRSTTRPSARWWARICAWARAPAPR